MTHTRADDERLLRAMRLHERGHTIASIARALGMSASTLSGQLHDVARAESVPGCAVCGAGLGPKNTTGVCKAHNHAKGFCGRMQCGRAA